MGSGRGYKLRCSTTISLEPHDLIYGEDIGKKYYTKLGYTKREDDEALKLRYGGECPT